MPAQRLFPILYSGSRQRDELVDLRTHGIMQIVIGIPWPMIAPHERQAQANHHQTLEELADRGGLSVGEAVLVLTGRSLTFARDTPADHALLNRLLEDYLIHPGKIVKPPKV